MPNMKRILLIILIVVVLAISAALVYLNTVVLPVKVKALIISSLEEATGKNVSLESIKFGIFKGLVVKDLAIGDAENTVLRIKETALRPFIFPFLRKEVIIPVIRINSPKIRLERKTDGTFNIAGFFKNYKMGSGEFKFIVNKISIKDGVLDFTDNVFAEPFKKEFSNLSADVRFILPNKIRFEVDCETPGLPQTIIGVWGEYNLPDSSVTAKLTLTDASLKDLKPYYEVYKIDFPEGKIDGIVNMKFAAGILKADIDARAKELSVSKDKIYAKFNSGIKAEASYNFSDKSLKYSADMSVQNMEITGVKDIDKIENVRTEARFTESSFSAKNVTAVVFGMPIKCELYIPDYAMPLLSIDITSELTLGALKQLLRDRFNMPIPVDMRGGGKLYLKMEYELIENGASEMNGYLDMEKATIIFNKEKPPIEIEAGQVQFNEKQLSWSGLNFKYRETFYNTSGTLTNFDSPGVQLELNSRDLFLKTSAAVSGDVINISRLAGKYLGSEFLVKGDVDISDIADVKADISGVLNTGLEDLKKIFEKSKEIFEKTKLSGDIKADFSLSGHVNDINSLAIDAKIFSNSITIYELKPVNVIIEYSQREGIGDITRFHSFLYGGTADASIKLNLLTKGLPYSAIVDINGVKIEGLKTATPFKDKEISGTMRLQARLNGFFDDSSPIEGSGKIAITNGNLWQLNLFKGLGTLLFASDFNNVVFRDGRCSFLIKDKVFSMDDIALKSNLIDLYGSARMGFDKTIEASFKSEFTKEALSSGMVSDLGAQVGQYSIISIKGTFKDPKYSMKPDMANIAAAIAEKFIQ